MSEPFVHRENPSIILPAGEFFMSRSVAIVGGVTLLCKGKLYMLITKRAEHMRDAPGRWCLPCGYLDWDENIYEATIREIYEETHLDLRLDYKMFSYQNLYVDSSPFSNRQNVTILNGFLIVSEEFPDVKITEETSDVAWCDASCLLDKNLAFGQWKLAQFVITKAMQQEM